MPKHHHTDPVIDVQGVRLPGSVAARLEAPCPAVMAEAGAVLAQWAAIAPTMRTCVRAGVDSAGPEGPAFAWLRAPRGATITVDSQVVPGYALGIRELRVDGEPVPYVHDLPDGLIGTSKES